MCLTSHDTIVSPSPKTDYFFSRSCYECVNPRFLSFCFQLESLTNHVQKWRELSEKFNKRLVSSEEEMTHRVSLLLYLACIVSGAAIMTNFKISESAVFMS